MAPWDVAGEITIKLLYVPLPELEGMIVPQDLRAPLTKSEACEAK